MYIDNMHMYTHTHMAYICKCISYLWKATHEIDNRVDS